MLNLRQMIVLNLSLLALVLTGCASVESGPKLPPISAYLFNSPIAAPNPPTNEELAGENGDNVLGVYISKLDQAQISCEATLVNIQNVLEVMGLEVTDKPPEAEPEEPKRSLWKLW